MGTFLSPEQRAAGLERPLKLHIPVEVILLPNAANYFQHEAGYFGAPQLLRVGAWSRWGRNRGRQPPRGRSRPQPAPHAGPFFPQYLSGDHSPRAGWLAAPVGSAGRARRGNPSGGSETDPEGHTLVSLSPPPPLTPCSVLCFGAHPSLYCYGYKRHVTVIKGNFVSGWWLQPVICGSDLQLHPTAQTSTSEKDEHSLPGHQCPSGGQGLGSTALCPLEAAGTPWSRRDPLPSPGREGTSSPSARGGRSAAPRW